MGREELIVKGIRELIASHFDEDEVLYHEEIDSESIIITINLPITEEENKATDTRTLYNRWWKQIEEEVD